LLPVGIGMVEIKEDVTGEEIETTLGSLRSTIIV
jgi:hypothetical protein